MFKSYWHLINLGPFRISTRDWKFVWLFPQHVVVCQSVSSWKFAAFSFRCISESLTDGFIPLTDSHDLEWLYYSASFLDLLRTAWHIWVLQVKDVSLLQITHLLECIIFFHSNKFILYFKLWMIRETISNY